MKGILLIIVATFSFAAQSHEFHTPNYCHSQVQGFCAHLGYSSQPKVNEIFEFVVDLVATPEELAKVQSANVELYMPYLNQSSSPLKVKRLDVKHFQVSEAYFWIAGTWIVNVEVITTSGPVLLQIPFEVK